MKVAVIGSGISGLAAAYLLHTHHQVTLFEKEGRAGGHSRTVEVSVAGQQIPVDTGFIVFNHKNYPLLTALFQHLNVKTAPSDMSFGVSINNGWLEYGSRNPLSIFSQPQNLIRPKFWGMLRDIQRFNAQASRFLSADASVSLGDCLDELGLGDWFRDYYLLAMGACIWSTPLSKMLHFPARTFIRFFENHGLLTINDHPQWHTVCGGSRQYVEKISASFAPSVRLSCGAVKVQRGPNGVVVYDAQGQQSHFDQVVFACHADQALALIEKPTEAERSVLAAFSYQPNRVVLHTDANLMPKRRQAWSSWVYRADTAGHSDTNVSLSYWMNNLQPLACDTPIIVTLNPQHEPDPAHVLNETSLEHPVFDSKAVEAQARLHEIQGQDRVWFCGAYQRYGFHEDGLMSAVNVAYAMGADPRWLPSNWEAPDWSSAMRLHAEPTSKSGPGFLAAGA